MRHPILNLRLGLVIVVVCALTVYGLWPHSDIPSDKNIQVNRRLVLLHPDYAEQWVNEMRRSMWFADLVEPAFSLANETDAVTIDGKMAEFFLVTASQNELRGKHYWSGSRIFPVG